MSEINMSGAKELVSKKGVRFLQKTVVEESKMSIPAEYKEAYLSYVKGTGLVVRQTIKKTEVEKEANRIKRKQESDRKKAEKEALKEKKRKLREEAQKKKLEQKEKDKKAKAIAKEKLEKERIAIAKKKLEERIKKAEERVAKLKSV